MVRTDMDWQLQGTMAALAEDLSPIYIGQRGKHGRNAFTVVGRVQKRYEEGSWNEWLLHLDSERSAWLSEGSGKFYLTVPSHSSETLPSQSASQIGVTLQLAGKQYCVSNIESAACVATEGEIPFTASPGDKYLFVDLTGEDNQFATIDYSEAQPQLYVGRIVEISDLHLEHGDKPLAKQVAESLRCASCGNSSALQNPDSLVVACASCGAVNNLSAGKLVLAYSQAKVRLRPKIPLGSKGALAGDEYEVIGFMERTGGGSLWDEYLLYSKTRGVRWLVCAYGHWSLVRSCAQPKTSGSDISFEGKIYKHFSSYQAVCDGVVGEFYWQVKKNEKVQCADFICPPYVLSSEKSAKEIVWSHGTYLDADEVAAAFSIDKPRRKSVGINQPSPPVFPYFLTFIGALLAAFLLAWLVHAAKVQTIKIGDLVVGPDARSATLISQPFTLNASHALLHVNTNTSISNDWASFEYRLINQATGEARLMNREIAFYSGVDDEGYWSEGDRYDSASLSNIEAGTYVLEVDAEGDRYSHSNITAQIDVAHGEGSGKNIMLLFLVLALGPLLGGAYWYFFEKERWGDSDHPWE
jgi:hypothetical protein